MVLHCTWHTTWHLWFPLFGSKCWVWFNFLCTFSNFNNQTDLLAISQTVAPSAMKGHSLVKHWDMLSSNAFIFSEGALERTSVLYMVARGISCLWGNREIYKQICSVLSKNIFLYPSLLIYLFILLKVVLNLGLTH